MYVLMSPKGYPIMCQIRRRTPGNQDEISTTVRDSSGAFQFRPLSDGERLIEKMSVEERHNDNSIQ